MTILERFLSELLDDDRLSAVSSRSRDSRSPASGAIPLEDEPAGGWG